MAPSPPFAAIEPGPPPSGGDARIMPCDWCYAANTERHSGQALSKANFAIIGHCIYGGEIVHHWMHDMPEQPPPMPYNMAATVMDNSDGQRVARACVVFKADIAAENPQMEAYAMQMVEHIEAVSEILERPHHTLLLVTFKLRDPLSVPDEDDCVTVFTRQYTEHTIMGRA